MRFISNKIPIKCPIGTTSWLLKKSKDSTEMSRRDYLLVTQKSKDSNQMSRRDNLLVTQEIKRFH
jgi:hypothetical protein